MKINLIPLIKCPYCDSKFQLGTIYKKINKTIVYGTLYCLCDEFPIVDEILYLDRHNHRKILNSLLEKKYTEALNQSLFSYGITSKFAFFRRIKTKILLSIAQPAFNASPNFLTQCAQFIFGYVYGDKATAQYHLHRYLEKDYYLFFLPLLIKNLEKNQVWLNIGSGIRTPYASQPLLSKVTFISLENNFIDLYLSHHLFKNSQTISICVDVTQGLPVKSESISIVTAIDSVPFIENIRALVKAIQEIATQNQDLLFLATAIPEHYYLSLDTTVFPIRKKTLSKFFKNPPTFFDHNQLSQALFEPTFTWKKALISEKTSSFRYDFIWQPKPLKSFKQNLTPTKVLPTFSTQAFQIWDNAKPQWFNRIFT